MLIYVVSVVICIVNNVSRVISVLVMICGIDVFLCCVGCWVLIRDIKYILFFFEDCCGLIL